MPKTFGQVGRRSSGKCRINDSNMLGESGGEKQMNIGMRKLIIKATLGNVIDVRSTVIGEVA